MPLHRRQFAGALETRPQRLPRDLAFRQTSSSRLLVQCVRQLRPLHKRYKIYLDPVGVAHVPEYYEDRLTEIFRGSFEHLRLCALDPCDLALSKLERNIQRDRDDIKHLAKNVQLELDVLQERYQKELRWQLGNPDREDLTLRLWVEAIEEEARVRRGLRLRVEPALPQVVLVPGANVQVIIALESCTSCVHTDFCRAQVLDTLVAFARTD